LFIFYTYKDSPCRINKGITTPGGFITKAKLNLN